MPHPTPPVATSRRRRNAAAARRRNDAHLGGHPDVPTAAPGPATHTQQPVSAPRPSNVLGGRGGPAGDTYLPGQQLNSGSPEAATVGWGADRVGKKFTVGFDRNGNMVHLYGSDVPAAERRQVIKKRP